MKVMKRMKENGNFIILNCIWQYGKGTYEWENNFPIAIWN